MAWANVIPTTRDAAQGYASTNVPNYTGTAYGMNRPGNWESGWSPTGQMSQRPYQPNRDSGSLWGYYGPSMFNKTPEMGWANMAGSEPYDPEARKGGGGRDWMPRGTFTNIPSQRGWKEDEIEGPNIPPGGIMDSGPVQDLKRAPGNAWSDLKNMFGGFKPPSFMLADSIVKNQAQHRDLDQYFQSTAGDNWRKAKDLAFFDQQGFFDAAQTGNIGLLSKQGRQAHGRFSRAGITDNVLEKFMDPSYKFYGNEAWLRSQANDNELFDEGMSFLKNAADTSEMHGMMRRGQQTAADDYYTKGELYDVDPSGDPLGDPEDYVLGNELYEQYPDEPGMMHTAEDLALLEDEDDFVLDPSVLYDQHMDSPSGYMMKPETRKLPRNMLPQIDYFGLDEDERTGTYTGPLGLIPKHRR